MAVEGIRNCFCSHILQWYSNRPSREAVNHCKTITIVINLWHGDQIKVNMAESLIGYIDVVGLAAIMAVNFRTLARLALPITFQHILPNTKLNVFFSQSTGCSATARMCYTMHNVEFQFSQGDWEKWSNRSRRNVTEYLLSLKRYLMEVQR